MAGNNSKGRLAAVPPIAPVRPANIAAQLTVTAFTDRPPNLQCSGDVVTALRLLSATAAIIANSLEQGKPQEAPVEDKPRQFLGPREG